MFIRLIWLGSILIFFDDRDKTPGDNQLGGKL